MWYRLLLGLGAVFAFNQAHAQAFDDWGWATVIDLDNTSSIVALSDYQVRLEVDTATLIGAGKLNADGSDLRFGDTGETTTYCHFVESGMNTASTVIWVRVPSLPASGSADMLMVYGNPGAADASNPGCTFDLFEDFETDLGVFNNAGCGSLVANATGGEAAVSWSGSGLLISDTLFPISSSYVAEMDVTAASGTWPSLQWTTNDADPKSYSIMINSTLARISVQGASNGLCVGHNWASAQVPFSSVQGIWSIAWPEDGVQEATFPTIADLSATDATWSRSQNGNTDLRLKIGGINTGSGSLNAEWVRVRKWAATEPGFTLGAEREIQAPPPPPEPYEAVPVPSTDRWALLLMLLGVGLIVVRRLS